MDDLIAQMIAGYFNSLDNYDIKDDSIQKEVDEYKKKLTDFADSISDVTDFYSKFAESVLQEEFSNIISKVAMSNLESPNHEKEENNEGNGEEIEEQKNKKNGEEDKGKEKSSSSLISVKEFVEQYRFSYNELIKAKYRKRGKAAYEKIFEVADKTDDMLEAQMIFEKERLLWKIIPEDALDIFETTLEAMDPIQEATTMTLIKNIESYKKAESEEELIYLLDLAEIDRETGIQNSKIRIEIAILFAYLLTAFNISKITIYQWPGDDAVKSAIDGMISSRHSLLRALTLLKEHYNMTFDDLLNCEEMKIWLLNPRVIDGLGRIKTAMSPENFDVFKDTIDNEIIPDITIEEILMRKGKYMIYLDIEGSEEKEFNIKAEKRAEELNAHLLYHQFKDELFEHVKGDIEDFSS